MNLQISERAKREIKILLEKDKVDLIPCIGWSEDLDGSNAGWGLGFHEKESIPIDALTKISDVVLLIDGPGPCMTQLENKILDYVDGRFVFLDE